MTSDDDLIAWCRHTAEHEVSNYRWESDADREAAVADRLSFLLRHEMARRAYHAGDRKALVRFWWAQAGLDVAELSDPKGAA